VPTIGGIAGFTAVQTYTYDSLDRIKSAAELVAGNQTWKQTFLFDRFGNRTFDIANTTIQSVDSAIPKVANPEILQANNKLKEDQDSDGQADYLYDLSGNLVKDARNQQFTYNAENLQASATGSSLSMIYGYDGNNKRVKAYDAVNNKATIFVYDAEGDLAAEYAINAPPPTTPTISYLTEDALGSVRITTNSFGEIKARRDFLPYGEELYAGLGGRSTNQKYSSSTDDARKKFATYQRDTETGLDFAQSRYYSPMNGRFILSNPTPTGPRQRQTRAEQVADVASILPLPGGKYVGGIVGKILFKGAAKTVAKPVVKTVINSIKYSNKGVKATTRYKRPNNATTKAQRKSVQGKPCVDCGKTTAKQVANHKEPLVKEHYETGTINRTKMKDLKSVNSQCPTCSAKQGAELSRYSKEMKKKIKEE